MTNDYVEKEVGKIMKDEQYPFPLNVALSCVWVASNLKGSQLKIMDLQKLTALADYFVLASAQNPIQAQAMADEISVQVRKYGVVIRSREGSKDSDWILLDLGHVIVHLFLDSSRQVYDLDDLWKMAPQVKIPENFYYGPGLEVPAKDKEKDKDKDKEKDSDSLDHYY